MALDFMSLGIETAIVSTITGGVQFVIWAILQRNIERRDKDLDSLTATVVALKDEKVKQIEHSLAGTTKELHGHLDEVKKAHGEGQVELRKELVKTAGELYEKFGALKDSIPVNCVTRRECAISHEGLGREIGQLRRFLSCLQATATDTDKVVNENAAVTKLIASHLEIKL